MSLVNKYKQIIFVDEENTSLSVFAARMMEKKLLMARIYDVRATSRGTVVLFPEPVNPKAAEIAQEYEITLDSHRAMQLNDISFADEVLVLALDVVSMQKIFENYPGARNVYLLKEYLGEVGDISFPIGEPVEKYRPVCETMDRLLELLLSKFTTPDERD